MTLKQFNESVGVQFESSIEYQSFRKNTFVQDQTQTLMIISFVDSSNQILYEVCNYMIGWVVFRNRTLRYMTQKCVQLSSSRTGLTVRQGFSQLIVFLISHVYFQQNGIFSFLGQYNFPQQINYSVLDQTICFTCDQLDNTFTYAKSTCAQNWALTRDKIALSSNATVGLIYANLFDNFNQQTIITQYNSTWIPFIVTSALLVLVVVFMVLYLVTTQKQVINYYKQKLQ
ncbi:Hypothetical_protein [Hexamita inflata]|uniref:Hypothetical_protein n=1 Tax=Hexamita inflata TaxID=28002 RepID=A0AA86NIE2_9EUKA|nr:Hypothetical protein HINF_LOCUS7249 [Hexamita inflata]